MKSILFIGSLNNGGAENQMSIIARQFQSQGHKVIYLCIDNSSFHLEELRESGIDVRFVDYPRMVKSLKLSYFYLAYIIMRILKREKIDASISSLMQQNFANCLAAKYSSRKHITIVGIRNAYRNLFESFSGRFYVSYYKHADFIVSNSDAARFMFLDIFPKYASKMTTVYNAVKDIAVKTDYIPKRDSKLHIVIAASYREVKNPYGLLDALKLMDQSERNRIVIDWYGNNVNNSYYDNLKSCVDQEKLNDVFRLHGATHDIMDRMNEADMVALFSKAEGFPNAICEGMMVEKPIIITEVSDYKSIVDASNGFVCKWNDAESIKAALVLASEMPIADLVKMGKCSKQRAIKLFSLPVIYDKWYSMINNN